MTHTSRPATNTPDQAAARRYLRAFYAVVLVVALAGSVGAAGHWLRWPMILCVVAVGAVELGGVAMSSYADVRRQLGERAGAARTVSAGVALGAVALNWFGHPADPLQAGFFAGMSALGYAVWLIDTAARRRDALRASGDLAAPTPVYGLAEWCRRPGVVRRARLLALDDRTLDRSTSLRRAVEQLAAERRRTAIAAALRARIGGQVDAVTAEIATASFDLDQVADLVAQAADLPGFAALISAGLDPAKIAGQTARGADNGADKRPAIDAATNADTVTADLTDPASADMTAPVSGQVATQPAERPDPDADTRPATNGRQTRPRPAGRATAQTAAKASRILDRSPDIDAATLAARVHCAERTARRYIAAHKPAKLRAVPNRRAS